jgi:hypothetical protein
MPLIRLKLDSGLHQKGTTQAISRIVIIGEVGTLLAIWFDLSRTQQIVEALRGKVEHYLFCSSIWAYGHHVTVPSSEVELPAPIDSYERLKPE